MLRNGKSSSVVNLFMKMKLVPTKMKAPAMHKVAPGALVLPLQQLAELLTKLNHFQLQFSTAPTSIFSTKQRNIIITRQVVIMVNTSITDHHFTTSLVHSYLSSFSLLTSTDLERFTLNLRR